MQKYSVLTYNLGGYEKLHEVKYKSKNAEYIYVTDDRSITSKTWDVVYIDRKSDDVFADCYDIRFNPFNYVHTDVVLRIDGSVRITKSPDKIVKEFLDGDYDCALMLHPARNTMVDEYAAWVNAREYPIEQAKTIISFMEAVQKYDTVKYRGMIQGGWCIQKKNKMNLDWNSMTLSFLHYLAMDGHETERVNQTIWSMVLQKYFPAMKVMPVSQQIIDNQYFKWYYHNSDKRIVHRPAAQISPYLFDKPVNFHQLEAYTDIANKLKENTHYIQFPIGSVYQEYPDFVKIEKLPVHEDMRYLDWQYNEHHYTTEYHRKYVIPLICKLLNLNFDEKQFQLAPKISNGTWDISMWEPLVNYAFDGQCYETGVKNKDMGYKDLASYKSATVGIITDYHKLFAYPHSSCHIVNKDIDSDRILLVSCDSQMVPVIPFLCCFFKEVYVMDRRTTIETKVKWEKAKITDILFCLYDKDLSYYTENNLH